MSCGRVQAREAPGGVAQLRLWLPESWVRTVRLAQRLWTLTRPGRRQVRADSRARSTPGGRGVSEGQSASRGPREMNKRPASRSAPRLATLSSRPGRPGPRGFLPGTAALRAPARQACAALRQSSCRGPSAAQRPCFSTGPAPGRSRRPLLKDRLAARRTKPAPGHGPPRAANLVSRYSGVAPRRPIGGRAESGAAPTLLPPPAAGRDRAAAAGVGRRPRATYLQRAFAGSWMQAQQVATPPPCD